MHGNLSSGSFAQYNGHLILAPKDSQILKDKLVTQNFHCYYQMQLHISVLDNTRLWDSQDPGIKYLRSVKLGPMQLNKTYTWAGTENSSIILYPPSQISRGNVVAVLHTNPPPLQIEIGITNFEVTFRKQYS